MNYLIFSSFEVGGWPFKMAEILNRHGIKAYHLSLQSEKQAGHDSKGFHYGNHIEDWELSSLIEGLSFPEEIGKFLKEISKKYSITNCLATGSKSYILKQADINYTYWCYGSDLSQLCFEPILHGNHGLWKNFILTFLKNKQISPLISCGFFLMFPEGYIKYGQYPKFIEHPLLHLCPNSNRMEARMSIYNSDSLYLSHYQLEYYNRLKIKKNLAFIPHILVQIEYKDLLKKKEECKKEICKKINASHFMFSSVRHIWCGSKSFLEDNKANDIILKAYKKYLEISNDTESKLILVEKGEDVEASKDLAIELGIDQSVVWINEMPRNELDDYYQGASLCFGQFKTPCLTYSALEPLAFGTPCISYFQEDNIRKSNVPYYDEMPPVIDSKYPDEIALHMCKLMSDKKVYDDLAYKSWLWSKKSCSEENFVESFLNLFKTDC